MTSMKQADSYKPLEGFFAGILLSTACFYLISCIPTAEPKSAMLEVAVDPNYRPVPVIIRETHLVDTIEEVLDLCGGSGLKYGCTKSLGNTRQFVCLRSMKFDCKAHEVDHVIRGNNHVR